MGVAALRVFVTGHSSVDLFTTARITIYLLTILRWGRHQCERGAMRHNGVYKLIRVCFARFSIIMFLQGHLGLKDNRFTQATPVNVRVCGGKFFTTQCLIDVILGYCFYRKRVSSSFRGHQGTTLFWPCVVFRDSGTQHGSSSLAPPLSMSLTDAPPADSMFVARGSDLAYFSVVLCPSSSSSPTIAGDGTFLYFIVNYTVFLLGYTSWCH